MTQSTLKKGHARKWLSQSDHVTFCLAFPELIQNTLKTYTKDHDRFSSMRGIIPQIPSEQTTVQISVKLPCTSPKSLQGPPSPQPGCPLRIRPAMLFLDPLKRDLNPHLGHTCNRQRRVPVSRVPDPLHQLPIKNHRHLGPAWCLGHWGRGLFHSLCDHWFRGWCLGRRFWNQIRKWVVLDRPFRKLRCRHHARPFLTSCETISCANFRKSSAPGLFGA